MVAFKIFIFLSLGVEGIIAQQPEVTCITELGPLAAVHPIKMTSTKTQTITLIKKVIKQLERTVTPNAKTTTLTDYDTITVTETAGPEIKTATTTLIDTYTITATDIFTQTETDTVTETSTSTSISTIYPAPSGFVPLLDNGDYRPKVKARELGGEGVKPKKLDMFCSDGKIYPKQYPQRIKCIEIIFKTLAKTITSTVRGGATTLVPPTKTVTTIKTKTETTTKYPAEVSTTITTSTDTTITTTEDVTTTTTTTTTSTTQYVFPTDFYAACASENLVTTANGGIEINHWGGYNGVGTHQLTAANAYECCVSCFTTNYANCIGGAMDNLNCYNLYRDDGTCVMNRWNGGTYSTNDPPNQDDYDSGYNLPQLISVFNGPCGSMGND